MDDEHEKPRMEEATSELTFHLGILEVKKCMLKNNMCSWQRRTFVYANYIMAKLVDLAWDREVHVESYLNEGLVVGNGVDD